MDLRKIEQDLETISNEWKALRRNRWSDSGDNVGEVVELLMPSWRHLMSTVTDEELFQSEDDKSNEDDDGGGGWKDEGELESAASCNENMIATMMDADFGMCLSSGKNNIETDPTNVDDAANRTPNIWDKYAAKVSSSAKSKVATESVVSNTETLGGDFEEEEQMNMEDASPEIVLAGLDSLHERFTAIRPKIDKFHTKLKEVSSL